MDGLAQPMATKKHEEYRKVTARTTVFVFLVIFLWLSHFLV
jgi:hypothetical protein